ncbi:MAG: hypothetical protein JSR66_11810 [Proteobacteria bacterium]|nr:hypothetical protein [Pseudomonadota bacterium]
MAKGSARDRLSSIVRSVVLISSILVTPHSLGSESLDLPKQQAALNLISDFASKVCTDIPLRTDMSEAQISGEVSTQMRGLLEKLIDAGIEVNAGIKKKSYEGVQRGDLLEALRDSRKCKMDVFMQLKGTLLGGRSNSVPLHEPRTRASFDAAKYINVGTSRIGGKLNVAVVVQGLSDSDTRPLEIAMRSALDSRGYRIVSIFTTAFQHAGMGQKLYDGDPSLVGRLGLQRYCDVVLVGVLRFAGPAQRVAPDMFIREAVLDIRPVDPVSGSIGTPLEVSEKGGGTSEQLSTENALDRLKNSVESSVREWSWT